MLSALTVYAQSRPCGCRLHSIVGNMEEKCFLEDPRPDLKSSFFEEVAWLLPFSLHYFAVSRGAGSRLSCSSAPPLEPLGESGSSHHWAWCIEPHECPSWEQPAALQEVGAWAAAV